jgi:hypothetical protein
MHAGWVGIAALAAGSGVSGCSNREPAHPTSSPFTPCSGGTWSPAPPEFVDAATPVTGAKAPKRPRCDGLNVSADGSSPLIDDFEDGNASILVAEHRQGPWWIAHDKDCIPTPDGDKNDPLPVKPAPGNPSGFAMRLAAKDCAVGDKKWGFALGCAFNFTDDGFCAYDVAPYRGIQFWARGTAKLRLEVGLRSTEPVEYGGDGTCEANDSTGAACFDTYSIEFPLTEVWTLYHARWSDLHQRGWGVPVPFESSKVFGVQFEIDPAETRGKTAVFSVDNVRFFADQPDARPISR